MELDDLKTTWTEMNLKLERQALLNEKMIKTMVKQQTTNKLNRIIYTEFFSAFLILIIVFFILLNFKKLDTVTSQIAGIGSLLIFIFSMITGYLHWQKLQKINIVNNTVANSLKAIADWKMFFHKCKIVTYLVGVFLMYFGIILSIKLFFGKDVTWDIFTQNLFLFIIVIGTGLIANIIMIIIIYKKFYEAHINEISEMLEDLK